MQIRNRQASFVPVFLGTTLLLGLIISCRKEKTRREEPRHFVFALTNSAERNSVITYRRDTADGTLTYVSTDSTGGLGTAAPLASQGPIICSDDGKWVLAVNAASNSISVLKLTENGAQFISVTPSGGVRPISITQHNDLVYVLHSGENGTLTGFRLSPTGTLNAIASSKQTLGDSATNPAQVSFALNGTIIVVTLKAKNQILAFPVTNTGNLGTSFQVNSRGEFPYGFAVSNNGTLYVSEGKSGSMSVYQVSLSGIRTLAGPLTTFQASACWAAITPNEKYIYILNANSASITGFYANQSGYPLLNSNGITAKTGETPIDIQISPDSRFAYVLGFKEHVINCFQINETGSMEKIADRFTNPPGTTGICIK